MTITTKKAPKKTAKIRLCAVTQEQKTLEELMTEFIEFKEAQQVAARTMRDYRRYLKNFLEFSQNSIEEEKINGDIIDYFAQIPDTSPARYNHPYQHLSTFFNWAIRQDYIRKNPITTQGLKKKRDDGNIKPASIDDVKTLLDSFDTTVYTGLRNYVLTLVMLDTGIRTSEIVQLKNDAYNAAAKQIIIDKAIAKTRKNRVAFISPTTAAALNSFIKIKPAGWSEFLFPSRDGEQLTSHNMSHEFDKQCKRAGVKFTPYQLRHTFATYFVANGGDVFTLQELMGHSDIRMTKRYTEIDTSQKKKAHESYTPLNEFKTKQRVVNI